MNKRVIIVIEIRQKYFQLLLSTFENFQSQLEQNRVINYNFVNYNHNFSKPGRYYSMVVYLAEKI